VVDETTALLATALRDEEDWIADMCACAS